MRFVYRLPFEERKESFGDAEAEGWRHAVFHRLHIVFIKTLCLVVARIAHFLLLFESRALVLRIIEFAEALPHLRTSKQHLESLNNIWVCT